MALVIPGLIWAVFGAVLGGAIILNKAAFSNDAREIFILTLSVAVIIAILATLFEFGSPFLNRKFENKNAKRVNDNVIKGELKADISNQDLLAFHNSLGSVYNILYRRNWHWSLSVAIFVAFTDYLVFHQLGNVPIIFAAGFIAALTTSIYNATVAEGELMFSLRKEVRKMFKTRGLPHKENFTTSLHEKFRIFSLLIILILAMIFFLSSPLSLNLIIISLIGFAMVIMVSQAIFSGFYSAFKEVQSLAEKMGRGKKVIFCSGSTDYEIIALSQSLNQTVENIGKYQTSLEEAKSILELKVRERTKELADLNKRLEGKVEERTKELQERMEQLEKFNRLAVGRELKMVELKKEIGKLEEALRQAQGKD